MDNREMDIEIKELLQQVHQCPCCEEWWASMLKTTSDFSNVLAIENNGSLDDYDKENKLEMALADIHWDLGNLWKIFIDFEDGKCKVKKSTTPR